jgi:hypothetical protein
MKDRIPILEGFPLVVSALTVIMDEHEEIDQHELSTNT